MWGRVSEDDVGMMDKRGWQWEVCEGKGGRGKHGNRGRIGGGRGRMWWWPGGERPTGVKKGAEEEVLFGAEGFRVSLQ